MPDTKYGTRSHEITDAHQDHKKEPFNNALWRELLNSTSDEVNYFFNLNIEAISPFGFEILMNRKFLYGNLRRFYCYLGTKKNILDEMQAKVIQCFYEILIKKIASEYSSFFSSIVLVIMKDNFLYLTDKNYDCKPTDKLIDIQLRQVETTLLDDYSNYIIASLDSLVMAKGEVKGYKDRAINRWRFYQLYIMQEELYKKYSPCMSKREAQLFKNLPSLVSNMINIFFNKSVVSNAISTYEESLFQELILPRVDILYTVVSGNRKNIIVINSCSYHVEDNLSLSIDKRIYSDTFLTVKNTYLHYL